MHVVHHLMTQFVYFYITFAITLLYKQIYLNAPATLTNLLMHVCLENFEIFFSAISFSFLINDFVETSVQIKFSVFGLNGSEPSQFENLSRLGF